MEWVVNKVRPLKLTEEIVEQIRSMIIEGKLRPGEQLPPERALAVLLGVGRSSLREALNSLETLGLVEIRKRQGVYVQSVVSPHVVDPMRHLLEADRGSILELMELRRDLEVAAASQAARRRDTEDIGRLWDCYGRLAEAGGEQEAEMGLDRELHLAIAQTARNFLRVHMLRSFFDLSRDFLGRAVQHYCRDADHMTTVRLQHRSLVEAIAEGDPELARRRMNEHLTWVAYTWQQVGS